MMQERRGLRSCAAGRLLLVAKISSGGAEAQLEHMARAA
jgi:hypothetical protein